MSTLATINTEVDRIIKDNGGFLDTTDIDSFIQNQAVAHYSRHKPYFAITDISGDGTYSYEMTVTRFPYWKDGFSEIKWVRYPADEYQDPGAEKIDREDFTIYENASTKYLRFKTISPSAGKTIRTKYSGFHSVPATGDTTIYDADLGAFYNLVGAFCMMAMANRAGQNSESTIGADAVAYRDKSDVFGSRAKDLLKSYTDMIFPTVGAAIAQREFDTIYQELGYARLTHREWAR